LFREDTSRKGNEDSKGEWIWLMYFLHMYEFGTLKPVEVIFGSGVGGRIMEGMNQVMV
jgi:hypothetical protein